jgi:hypothetical protein
VIVKATHGDQRTASLLEITDETLPYFSTILVYTGGESW